MIELQEQANPEREAKDLVLGGHCIAFIGAGMSNPPAGQWRETVDDIATRCGVKNDNRPLPQIIDACQESNPDEYEKAFRDLFPKHTPVVRSALNYILRLPFKAYITTNVDPWLRNISRANEISRVHVYPDIPLSEGLSRAIYYIHGFYDSSDQKCDPKKLVFGHRTFLEAYGTQSLLPGFLLNLFTYEHILFLGFGPSEKNISQLLGRANGIRRRFTADQLSNKTSKRFIFLASPDESDTQAQAKWDAKSEEFRALELIPIVYNPKDKYHRGLEEILFGWVEQGKLKNRPPPFKTGLDL